MKAVIEAAPQLAINAWDINPENCTELGLVARNIDLVRCGDFLLNSYDQDESPFRLAIMNPPYDGNQDIAFIEHALDCSDRVVGIFQSRILHSKGRAAFWRHTDLQRMAILSARPRFGGPHSPKTDFVVMELVRLAAARRQGVPTPTLVEWW